MSVTTGILTHMRSHLLPWQKVHCPPRALRSRELQHFPVQHAPAHSTTVQLLTPLCFRLAYPGTERRERKIHPVLSAADNREPPVRVSSVNWLPRSRSASTLTHSHTRSAREGGREGGGDEHGREAWIERQHPKFLLLRPPFRWSRPAVPLLKNT